MIVCPDIGGFERVILHSEVPMSRVAIEAPTLVLIVRGSLRLRWAGNECVRSDGQAVAAAEGQTFDMITRSPPCGGPFEAHWITFDPLLTEAFAGGEPNGRPIRDAFAVDDHAKEFTNSFTRLAAAMTDPPRFPAEAPSLRARELLGWLAFAGAYFGRLERLSLTRRVRMAIAKDIDTAWTAERMAEELAIGASTMRRRLKEDGVSFHDLLIDVRMSRALTLLQVTDLSVLQIAYRTGYDSPSRFTARFRQRFGLSPSDVRAGNLRV